MATKKVTKIKVAPEVQPVDTAQLKELLVDLEGFVQGSGTNEDRQKAVDKLKAIILKLEGGPA